MAKNLSIVAQGISGTEGKLLGYNVTDNGIYTPAIGDVARDTTATYVAQDGLIKTAQPNVARVDYTNGVAELLLEPTSTNDIIFSEDFTKSQWGNTNGTIRTEKIIDFTNGTDGDNRVVVNFQTVKYSIGDDFTISCRFSYADNGKLIRLGYLGTSGGWVYSNDLTIDNKGFASFSVKNVSIDVQYIAIVQDTNETTNTLTLDTDTKGGIQCERLPYATSYIPTNGAIATRGADSLTNFGSEQIIDSQSGILFFEGSALVNGSNGNISISSGQSTNRITLNYTSTSNLINFSCVIGGTNQGSLSYNGSQLGNLKICMKYNQSIAEMFVNRVLQGTLPIIGFSENTLNILQFNQGNGTSVPFYGRIRQVKHLPYNTDITTL